VTDPKDKPEIATTEHGRFVFKVKEYAPNASEPYRVFIAAEPDEASNVPRFSIWLKEGTTFEEAQALVTQMNRLRDTVSVTSFLEVQGSDKPS
jgi:hypothetical protein